MKTSFILHLDSLAILDKLTPEQSGELFKAIYFYKKTGELPPLDFLLEIAITPFIKQFERDEIAYQRVIERNQKNGEKGGRPLKVSKKNPKNPVGFSETQKTQDNPEKPKKPDSDSDSVNDSDSDNKNNSDFLKFERWILENAKNVSRMKEPFTEQQYREIKAKYKTDFITDILKQMHNWADLLKKNNSAYLTFLNWAKKREADPQPAIVKQIPTATLPGYVKTIGQ